MLMLARWLQNYKRQVGIFGVLLVLWVIFTILSPATFLASRIYTAFMSTIPFSAIMALSLTLVIVSGQIDMSFPSLMALSGFVFASTVKTTGNVWLGIIGGLASGAFAGLINGVLVTKVGVPAIIVTIGTQFFWRGLTTLLCGGLAINLGSVRQTVGYHMFVGRVGDLIPAQALWCAAIAVFLWSLLHRHTFGDSICFIGDNRHTADLMGIAVDRTLILTFVQMGFFTAFAGILVCFEMANWWPTQGEGYMLLVFASVFIGGTSVYGGTGTIFGTCIGAIIIGIIEAGIISAGYSGFWTRLIHGVILVCSVSGYSLLAKKKPFWLLKKEK
jgi:simple sugar transport system permease protein